jgi:hypothetical protein
MKVIYAPLRIRGILPPPTVFLAGSIDLGTARDWQKEFEREFEHFPCTIYNPRRPDWDSSWKQTSTDPKFSEQVNWELDFINAATNVFMFIGAESKAPISLLEFGIIASSRPKKLTICVEEGFYRRGNIEVVCERHDITLYSDFKQAVEKLKLKMVGEMSWT